MCRFCDRPNVFYSLSKEEGLSLLLHVLKINDGNSAYCSNFSDVKLVVIDVESFMRDHNLITEVGYASYITLDMPPSAGPHACDWIHGIHSHHFRIEEHGHKINGIGRNGHSLFAGDKFRVGRTEWISMQNMDAAITPLLVNQSAVPAKDKQLQRQNVVIVGHAVDNEFAYLKKMGINLEKLGNVVAVLDTQIMYGPFHGHKISLFDLISGFGISPLDLHNAGNDATYTLISAFRLALREATTRGISLPGTVAHADTSPNAPVETLRMLAKGRIGPDAASDKRCSYCGRLNHQREFCEAASCCSKCQVRGHSTDRCRKCPECSQWAKHQSDCSLSNIKYPHRWLQGRQKNRNSHATQQKLQGAPSTNRYKTANSSDIDSLDDYSPTALPIPTVRIPSYRPIAQNIRAVNVYLAPAQSSPNSGKEQLSAKASSTAAPGVNNINHSMKQLTFAEVARQNAWK